MSQWRSNIINTSVFPVAHTAQQPQI